MGNKISKSFLIALAFLLNLEIYAADIRYITDQCEATLHKEKHPNSEVIARLPSGTKVKLLKVAGADGYAKIATATKTAWVLESLLLKQPVGKDKYLASKMELEKLKAEFNTAVDKRTKELKTELEVLKSISKKPIQLQSENKKLRMDLELERQRLQIALKENAQFKSIHKDKDWLITGALISILSLILGLLITKIQWKKRRGWGEY